MLVEKRQGTTDSPKSITKLKTLLKVAQKLPNKPAAKTNKEAPMY